MAPLKTTLGRSVGKLIESFRGRDAIGGLKLNSTVVSNFFNATYGASGGTEVSSPTHKYHVFTTPGTFAVTGIIPSVDIVVVGGGGGGYPGNPAGGGGGGGGVYIRTLPNQSVDLTATVGEGGNPNPNTAGEATILATPTAPTAYVAPGGYIGGSDNNGGNSYPPPAGTNQSAGPLLYQHGSGGAANGDTGGGGGGSGEAADGEAGAGGPGCSETGADGGTGMGTGGNFAGPIFAPIMPTDFVDALGPAGRFGGGGAGAIRCAPGGSNTPGSGGAGGGGRGGAEPNHPGGGDPGRNGGGGVANTGGGGGGAHSYGGVGGAGGDGVVICRYEIAS